MITNPSKWSMKDLDVLIIGGSISGLLPPSLWLATGERMNSRAFCGRSIRSGRRNDGAARSAAHLYRLRRRVRTGRNDLVASQKQFFDEREIKAPDAQSATWAGILRSLQRRLETCEGSVDLRTGYELTHISPSESRPCVQYQNGEIETADLIVVADGAQSSAMNSPTRCPPNLCRPCLCWRGQLPMSSQMTPNKPSLNRPFEQMTTAMGTLPVSHTLIMSADAL